MLILGIFLAGVLVDVLVAKYTLAVAQRKPLCAANLSALLAFVNLLVLAAILRDSIVSVLAYAAGNWMGTYLVTRSPGLSRKKHW